MKPITDSTMVGESDDVGFVIDLTAETVTFDGGFVAPITNILDRDGYDLVGNTEDATFIVVKVPPEGLHVTVDLRDLRDQGVVTTPH